MTRRWPSEANPHSGTWVRDQVAALERLGIRCDVLQDVTGRGIWPYVRMRRKMAALLARERYDVVHAHYGFTGIVGATQRSVPVVVTFHGTDVLGRPYAGLYRRIFGRVERRLSRLLARRIAHAVVVSAKIQVELKAPPRSTVIPMGIDLERFAPAPRAQARRRLGLGGDAPIVIFVGDPSLPVKRFALAREAVERARREMPTVQLIPVYHRTPEEVAAFMSAADALILTSHSEGSPTVIKEALSCNLPVVSVAVGDVREQLRGVANTYVGPADAADLAAALTRIVSSPARSDGRDFAARFSNAQLASDLACVYRRVARCGDGRWSADEIPLDR
jgi:teichuronic acid biosynthesis glycosyltransferase TuaC